MVDMAEMTTAEKLDYYRKRIQELEEALDRIAPSGPTSGDVLSYVEIALEYGKALDRIQELEATVEHYEKACKQFEHTVEELETRVQELEEAQKAVRDYCWHWAGKRRAGDYGDFHAVVIFQFLKHGEPLPPAPAPEGEE